MNAEYLSDYQKMMKELSEALTHKPKLAEMVTTYIEGLEQQKSNAQQQYVETFGRLEKVDYELHNLQNANAHIGKTVKLYEIENAALKEVVRAHGQLAAVMLNV
jgi:hypothetical protein